MVHALDRDVLFKRSMHNTLNMALCISATHCRQPRIGGVIIAIVHSVGAVGSNDYICIMKFAQV